MPRKSFEVKPESLRWYREKLGWTQREVGKRLRGLEDSEDQDELATATNSYSRIENRGLTTPRRAQEIARILGVPLEALTKGFSERDGKGFGPLLHTLEAALQRIKGNPEREQRLRQDLEKSRLSPWQWILGKLECLDVRSVALDIVRQLESSALERVGSEREVLSKLLDLPEGSEKQTAYADGTWFVYAPKLGFKTVGSVISGIVFMLAHVEVLTRSTGKTALKAHLSKELDCIRIDFEHEIAELDWWIEISRCTPIVNHSGMEYESPPPNDSELIRLNLIRTMSLYAWLVEYLESEKTPPAELLAFHVTSNPVDPEIKPINKIISGSHNLAELDSELFRDRSLGGLGNRHVWHVKYNLVPDLVEWFAGLISPKTSLKIIRNGAQLTVEEMKNNGFVTYYPIQLVRVDDMEPAAWPLSAVDDLVKKLETLIQNSK